MIAATQSNHPLAGPTATPTPAPVEVAFARLREAGMRITKPRIALLEALARLPRPVPIEELHQQLDKAACDLVTVYRCLAAFEDIGLVRRSFLHNGTSLYELLPHGTPQHYHVVCKICSRTERVDYFPIDGAERMLRERGYANVTHLVEFFGICPTCQAAAPRRETAPPTPPRM